MPDSVVELVLLIVLVLASFGVILLKQPVHACLAFLLTLLTLAALYLQLSAQFIAVLQVLVYAGAILVIFMFVVVLFQDAHAHISRFKAKSSWLLGYGAAAIFLAMIALIINRVLGLMAFREKVPATYGTAEALGEALYLDFFFPFEAVVVLFLVAIVGALYMGKKAY